MNRTAPEFATTIRAHALRMVSKANASHIGTCLSMADLLAALYTEHLRVDPKNPEWPDRDRFILSKGHGAAILYATLAERGFFPLEWLNDYCQDGSPLTGHISHHAPGVEVSTGSLGHGLPIGCGMAIAAKRDKKNWRTFVLLSDGELDEGSNWEAILFAGHHRLDNLIAIVDYNKIQSFGSVKEVLDLEPLAAKWKAFNWAAREMDGHNHSEIQAAFKALPFEPSKPSVVIAHTVKGKGISYMENQLLWHYRAPNPELLAKGLLELGEEP
jgi:transketolase